MEKFNKVKQQISKRFNFIFKITKIWGKKMVVY